MEAYIANRRLPERSFHSLRSRALFYFPNLPALMNKLSLSNRGLARATEKFLERPLTEGTVRRMVKGEPAGFIRVKAVFDAVNEAYKKWEDPEGLDPNTEIVQFVYKIPALTTLISESKTSPEEISKRIHIRPNGLKQMEEGGRVSWGVAKEVLDTLNAIRAAHHMEPLGEDVITFETGGEREAPHPVDLKTVEELYA